MLVWYPFMIMQMFAFSIGLVLIFWIVNLGAQDQWGWSVYD